MSDTPAGTDWWQASDGKWYPPEQHPDNRPPERPPSSWGTYGQQPSSGAPPYQGQAPYGTPPQYGQPGYQTYGQYGPGYQTYGGPGQYGQYGGYGVGAQTSSKATVALVLSIVSFVVCPVIPAIIALVVASQAAREIRTSNGRFTGQGLVTASRIISVANIVLVALAVIAVVAVLPSAVDDLEGIATTAQDRFVQGELEDAAAAADAYYEQHGSYPFDPQALASAEPSLTFVPGSAPNTSGVIVTQTTGESMSFGAVSTSTTCFYVRTTPTTTTYAEDVNCGPFSAQLFEDTW